MNETEKTLSPLLSKHFYALGRAQDAEERAAAITLARRDFERRRLPEHLRPFFERHIGILEDE